MATANNSCATVADSATDRNSFALMNTTTLSESTGVKKTYAVLLADDSPDDRFFLRRAMDDCARFRPIAEVEDGADAIAYLKGEGDFSDRSKYALPDLLLLDLKMPRASGFDVLKWLKDSAFPSLMVAVLSGSVLDSDKDKCRQLGAHAYFTKCASVSQLKLMLNEVEAMLDQMAIPTRGRAASLAS